LEEDEEKAETLLIPRQDHQAWLPKRRESDTVITPDSDHVITVEPDIDEKMVIASSVDKQNLEKPSPADTGWDGKGLALAE
jgi:hypothetical protein